MSARARWACLALAALFLTLWVLARRASDESHQSHPSHSSAVPTPAPHPAASALTHYAAPDTSPRDDLRAISAVLETFRLLAKGDALPLGSNEEISAALRGETRAKLALLPRTHPVFDARGRLADRWGTPLFFHAQSAKEIEIRSAGPDRELGTDDDIVSGPR